MEEKNSKSWLVIVVLLIIVVVVGYGVFEWTSLNTKTTENNVLKEKVSSEVKTKLERWVNVASRYNSVDTSTSTLEMFAKTKLIMTYNAVIEEKNIYDQKEYILTKDDIADMSANIDKSDMNNEPVKIMKMSDFNTTYKELFDEDASYEVKDLDFGCPTPWGMDKQKNRIYLFSRCGGTSPLYPEVKKTNYDLDDNYYYVHRQVDILNGDESDEVSETYKILWKFDKDLKFVSSEKE